MTATAKATSKEEKAEEAPARSVLYYKQVITAALIKPPDDAHPGFLFRDTNGMAYVVDAIDSAIFVIDGKYATPRNRRCIAIDSPEWHHLISREWWHLTGMPITSTTIKELTINIAAFAHDDDRPVHTVYRRVGEDADKNIVIDIGGDTGKVIVCTPEGWAVKDYADTDVWFQYSPRPLPIPVAGGTIDMLRKHVNIQSDDDFNLAVAWELAAFRPHGPYPNMTITGEAGSAKSTLARRLRDLIDPSETGIRTWADNPETIAIACTKQWVVAYDNLTSVRAQTSDMLCNMSTGGTYPARTLYTNLGETTVAVQRPLILTSVADVVNKPDLMDRALLIEMTLPKNDRYRTEAKLLAAFAQEAPLILGALLDVVCGALAVYPTLPDDDEEDLPRMADFAKWMLAASPALEWEPDYFLRIYAENRAKGTGVALDSNPWTAHLISILAEHFNADPNATQYSIEPQPLAARLNQKGALSSRGHPFNGRSLNTALKVLAGSLRKETGIDWRPAKSNGVRKYVFTHLARAAAANAAAAATATTIETPPAETSPQRNYAGTALGDELEGIFAKD